MSREHLVLLPGMLCDAELWQAQADALSDVADCQIMDLAGCSIGQMADHVLAQAAPTFALAGLSMGGYVALAVLYKAPERVSRVCLVNTSARPDTAAQAQARRSFIAQTEAGRFDEVLKTLAPLLTHRHRWDDVGLQARVSTMMHRVGAVNFVRQQTATAQRDDARPALATIAVPALIVGGRADRVTPPDHALEIAVAIHGAKLKLLDDCAHLTPMEAPAQLTTIMRDWLCMPRHALSF